MFLSSMHPRASSRSISRNPEDKTTATYSLMSATSAIDRLPDEASCALQEVGVLILVPVVLWCLMSWALSYSGLVDILVKLELFAFIPAAASAFACTRMSQLRKLPAEMKWLKDENEWFKSSNAELKEGVQILRHENEAAIATNEKLSKSISGLEDVRDAIEAYACRHQTDFGQALADFHRIVLEQRHILKRTRQLTRRTRKLAEAQWRALLLNMYSQVAGDDGMTRKDYELWLAMLPIEISQRIDPETFEGIDANGDDLIDLKEMCDWAQRAVKTMFGDRGGVHEQYHTSQDSSSTGDEPQEPASRQFSASTPSQPPRQRSPAWRRDPAKIAAPDSLLHLDVLRGGKTTGSSQQLSAQIAGSTERTSSLDLSKHSRKSPISRPSFDTGQLKMFFGAQGATLADQSTSSTARSTSPALSSPALHKAACQQEPDSDGPGAVRRPDQYPASSRQAASSLGGLLSCGGGGKRGTGLPPV